MKKTTTHEKKNSHCVLYPSPPGFKSTMPQQEPKPASVRVSGKWVKTEGIVLKKFLFGESDIIIRVLNTRGALVSLIAKGAKKSKKRFMGGVLEPTHFIGVEYRHTKTTSLYQLKQAWFLKRFVGLRDNYECLNTGLYFLSLMECVCQEGLEDSSDHFNLLGNGLKALCNSPDLKALQFLFELRLLYIQGILPREYQNNRPLLALTLSQHKNLIHKVPDFQDMISDIHSTLSHHTRLKPPHLSSASEYQSPENTNR